MGRLSWKQIRDPGRHVLWNLGLMALGSVLCATAVNGILIPRNFFGAGFTGVSLIIHYLVPAIPVAALYLLLNVPVFALGWVYVGRRFFLYSLAGMLCFTGALAGVHVVLPISDKILSGLFAGILMGTGGGIILRSFGSAGGMDILSVMLLKRFSLRIGHTILAFNVLILGAGGVLFSLEAALYTLVYLYVNARMVNLMVTGLSQRKAVLIISSEWKAISRGIMENIQRGVTVMDGRGGFTGREQKILYTVVTFRELARLKQLIRHWDPDSFMVVSDTLEVMGQRIGNQPHW